MYVLSFIHSSLVSSISSLVQLTLSVFGRGSLPANANVQDDLISTSGDGSQLADEESDHEEIFTNKPQVENSAKKKQQQQPRGRIRGRTPASTNPDDTSSLMTEATEFQENGVIQQKENIVWKPSQNGHPAILTNGSDYVTKYVNCNGKNSDELSNNNINKENNNSHFVADEYKQLNKEKEM